MVAVGAEEAEVRVSADGGRTFDTRTLPGVAVDLVVDPGAPARMVLSTQRGLCTSPHGGRGWRPGEPLMAGAQLAWAAPDALYRVDADGRVRASPDGGRSWRARHDGARARRSWQPTPAARSTLSSRARG